MSTSCNRLDASAVDEDDPDPVRYCVFSSTVKGKGIFNRDILPYIHSCVFPKLRPDSWRENGMRPGNFMPLSALGTGFHTESFSFFYGFEAAGR